MGGGVKILINKHKNPWQRWGGDIKGYAVTQNFLNALQHASGKYIFWLIKMMFGLLIG